MKLTSNQMMVIDFLKKGWTLVTFMAFTTSNSMSPVCIIAENWGKNGKTKTIHYGVFKSLLSRGIIEKVREKGEENYYKLKGDISD